MVGRGSRKYRQEDVLLLFAFLFYKYHLVQVFVNFVLRAFFVP